MSMFLLRLLDRCDGPLWHSFWNGVDWLAALGLGYGLGTWNGWQFHCASYLAGRAVGRWLWNKRVRDLETMTAQWRELRGPP